MMQAVHVVPAEGDSHAIAGVQNFAMLGRYVFRDAGNPPQIRNAGVIQFAAVREQSGAGAIENSVETIGDDRRFIGAASAFGIEQHANAIGLLGILGDIFAQELFEHRQTIFDGVRRQIVIEPIHVGAIVFYAFVLPKRFGNEHASLLVEAERHWIGHFRLGREQFDFHPFGHAKRGNRALTFVGPAQNCRFDGAMILGRFVGRILFVSLCGPIGRRWACGFLRKNRFGKLYMANANN